MEISSSLKLRLLDIQEFFTSQWLMSFPNDYQKLSELMNIRKQQISLKELVKDDDEDGSGQAGGGGRGTVRGFRAKDDPSRNGRKPFSTKM